MKFLIKKLNWSEHCSDDYDEIKWIIYDDLKVEIEEIYRFDKNNNKKYSSLTIQDFETISKNIDIIKSNDVEDVDALDGTAWEFIQYDGENEIWKRVAGYIYGIKPLETIADTLEKIRNQKSDLNIDRKELSEILEMFHNEIKDIKPDEIDKSVFLKYLQLLKGKLNSREYSSDKRFVTYCRRDFLRQEMTDRLEQKVYTGINYLLEAFYDLEDYINNDTWISIGSVLNLPNSKEIIENDISYKNDGKICKEEKEILINMIDEFIKKIDVPLYNNMPGINENIEDNIGVLLTLREWWGEGSYGYEKIDVFYDGKVMLEEKNETINETGKKIENERNEEIAILDENDLVCLSNIIQFINNNFNEHDIPQICDYGVEIIMNCGPLNTCIENETTLYKQLKDLLYVLINKNNQDINYSDIERKFFGQYLY